MSQDRCRWLLPAVLLPLASLVLGGAPPAQAQAATPAPGAPVCAGPSGAPPACVISGAGSVTLKENTYLYITAAPQVPHPETFTVPEGTELQVDPSSAGTVSIGEGSLTIAVATGRALQLYQRNDRPQLDSCTPVDNQINVVRCDFAPDPASISYPRLHFSAVDPSSEPQPAATSGSETALLIQPHSLAPLTVRVNDRVRMACDGEELDLQAEDGFAVNASPPSGCEGGADMPWQTPMFSAPSLYAPSRMACSPVIGGKVDVTVTPPLTVGYPGSGTLPPGGAVIFDPSPQAVASAKQILRRAMVISDADQPANLAYDGETLGVSAPAGFPIEILGPRTSAPACAAIGSTGDTVSCSIPCHGCYYRGFKAVQGGASLLQLSLLPPGSGRVTLSMPANTSASLFLPAADGEPQARAVSVSNDSYRPATIDWDGLSLTAVVSDVTVQAETPNAACATDADDPSRLVCATTGLSEAVTFRALTPLPPDSIALPFEDATGDGSLTLLRSGPDAVKDSTKVGVTLTRGAVAFTGSGVVRVAPEPTGTRIFFSLDDGQGGRRLFQGMVAEHDGAWAAAGIELNPGVTDPIQRWTAGTWTAVSSTRGFLTFMAAGPATPDAPTGPTFPLGPIPAQLVGPGEVFDPRGNHVIPSMPIETGRAGQPVRFVASASTGAESARVQFSYQWDFGDGTRVDTGVWPYGGPQSTDHTYSAPGAYSVVAIAIDSTGVSAFGAIPVAIVK